MNQLIEAAKAKAKRATKVVPVDVEGIGRLYVRLRLAGERDQADAASREGKPDLLCWGAARLLCTETGERISQKERDEWERIFMSLPEGDIALIANAADGNTDETAPGN